jgi:hypothetical protein
MFDRRLVQYFDWGLMGLAILIGCIGLITLYSAVTAETPTPQKVLFFKQLLWFSVGLVAMVVTFLFNYKLLDRWAQPIYFACIALLIVVLYSGKYVGGSRRWLIIGPVSFQPSELVKIAVILALARYYSKDAKTRGFTLRELVRPAVIIMLPVLLIGMQPDLGTAGLVVLIAGSITVFVKIERRSFTYLFASGAVLVPLIWFFISKKTDSRLFESGPGSAGGRVSHYSVQNRDRFRNAQRQRVLKRHPKRPFIPARGTHRFYFFGSGRRMGISRIDHPGSFISGPDHLGVERGAWMPGTLRYHRGRRGYGDDILADVHQYRHVDGTVAGGGCAAAICELRRIFGTNHSHRYWPVAKCKYETFYARLTP